MKRVQLYLIYFQSSAARPQASDRILCSALKFRRGNSERVARFLRAVTRTSKRYQGFDLLRACEYLLKGLLGKGLGRLIERMTVLNR